MTKKIIIVILALVASAQEQSSTRMGPISPTDANNVIHVAGNTGRSFATGLALCASGIQGCSVAVDSPFTFTAPISVGPVGFPIEIDCLAPSGVNGNPAGTLITYSPTTTGTAALTFTSLSRVIINNCDFTQGNSQANTSGIVFAGTQGGYLNFGQIFGFTGTGWTIADATNSSGEYNGCISEHVSNNGIGLLMSNTNNNKSLNQNHFANCAFVLNTTADIKFVSTATGGSISENEWSPVDVTGNVSPLVDLTGVGTSTCRDNVFGPMTMESIAPPSNQIGLANGPCQMTQIITEGGLTGAGTPVTVTNTTGTYDLKQGASLGPGGIKWEVKYPAFQIDKDGNMSLGAAVNLTPGNPPSINFLNGEAFEVVGVTIEQLKSTGVSIFGNADISSNGRVRGPDPDIDVLHPSVGLVGDANISKNVNVTGATATIISGTTRFAATDCQSGGGCTGAVNKVIAFNAGGPSGTITIAAPTPGANGQLISNINYHWQAVEIIDTGTLGTTGNTTNGWTLPTAEATIAEGANTSLAFPAASANVTNATGLRLYVGSPWSNATANSGDEVLQVPGKISFGTVTAGGAGCVGGGNITIGAPNQAGGIQAKAHTTCAGAAISGVVIDITGSGYTSNPTATPDNGTGTVTVTVGLLCSAQSAKNFRDFACDIGSTQTLSSLTMVGPLVPTLAGWRSVINAFTSTTVVSIADTIPNNIAGGNNFAGWGTDNTANWNANVIAFGPCVSQPIGTVSTSGCHVIFPGVGATGSPTGRYFFLNGLPWGNNGMQVEGRGGRGSTVNGGASISTTATPSAEIVELGDSYAVNIYSATGSLQGVQAINLGAEDLIPGLGWGGFNVGGDYGFSLTGTHFELDRLTAVNFVNGYGLQLTNVQRVNVYSLWAHAATQIRLNDSVSATQFFGGMVSGNLANTGEAYGIWISNNPIAAINQFGNIKFFGTQVIDGGYQGPRRISDSAYNVFYGLKQENIGLTGGAACPGGGTACWGAGLLLEGNTTARCVNNVDNDTQGARTVNYLSITVPIAGGVKCTQTDISNPIATQMSGNFCAQSPCNANDALLDLRLGNNSANAAQASFNAGGQAFGPDALVGATPAIDCSKGNLHIFRTIGQNITPTFNSASCADGQELTFQLTESGAGGPNNWTWPVGFVGATPINTAQGARTIETFHWDATNAVAARESGTHTVCVSSAPVTVNANVATDQNLMTCSLPAGLLNQVNSSLRVYIAGVFSTAAASTASLTFKVKLCTVSGCGSGTVISPVATTTGATAALSATNLSFSQTSYLSTQTAGAASAYEAHGFMTIDLSATPATPDSTYQDTNTATVGTIDSTAALFLQITAAASAASASNSFTERQLVVELIN